MTYIIAYLIGGLLYIPIWNYLANKLESQGFPGQYPVAELTAKRCILMVLLWPLLAFLWLVPTLVKLIAKAEGS